MQNKITRETPAAPLPQMGIESSQRTSTQGTLVVPQTLLELFPPKGDPEFDLSPSAQITKLHPDSIPLCPSPATPLRSKRRPHRKEKYVEQRRTRGCILKEHGDLNIRNETLLPPPPQPLLERFQGILRPNGEASPHRRRYPRNVWIKDREFDMREDLPAPLLDPIPDDDDGACWGDEWDY